MFPEGKKVSIGWSYDLQTGPAGRFVSMRLRFLSPVIPKGGLHVSVKDSPKGDQGALIELAGGEVWIRKVRTNGYTDEILRESLGRPVTISISINRRTLAVDGPFFGILPALEDLPYDPSDSWDTNAEGRVEGRRIMMGRAC